MLTQLIKFTVKPEHQQNMTNVLLASIEGTRQEPGNINIDIFTDKTDPNVFFAYERWQDAAAMEFHRQQPYTQHLLSILGDVLAQPPQIHNLHDTQPAPVAVKPANPEDDIFSIFFIFPVNAEFRQPILAQFENHIEHTRREAGCLLFDLYTTEEEANTLVVYEHWRKESDVWDIHFNQPYAKTTGALLAQAVEGDLKQYMHFVKALA